MTLMTNDMALQACIGDNDKQAKERQLMSRSFTKHNKNELV